MSHSHYGNGGGRPKQDYRDRDRDTSRNERVDRNDRIDRNDRSYNSRSVNSSRRYPPQSGNYNDQALGGNSRRPEGRDYYGYKSVSSRPESGGRGQGGPSGAASGNSSIRTERNVNSNGNSGPRARPGTGKPRGPSHGQNYGSNQRQSGAFTSAQVPSGAPRRDSRNETRNDTFFRESADNRRGSGRKQDWSVSSGSRQRDLHPGQPSNKRELSIKNANDSGVPKHVNVERRASSSGDSKGLRKDEASRSSGNGQAIKRALPNGSVPLLSEQNAPDDRSVRSNSKSPLSSKMKPSEHGTSSSALLDIASVKVQASSHKVEDAVKEAVSHLFDDDDSLSNVAYDETSIKGGASENKSLGDGVASETKNQGNESASHMDDAPDSPHSYGFDTSVLSPVGSAASDDAFTQTPGDSYERQLSKSHPLSEDESDASEAETVDEDEDIDLSKARSYLRKNGRDTQTERTKRRRVLFSDDEDSSEDLGEGASKSLDTKARKDRSHFAPSQTNEANEVRSELTKSTSHVSEPHSRDSTRTPEKSKSKKEEAGAKATYKIKRDSTGRSQLQRACKKGDIEEVRKLLVKGASANESDFGGFTCLHEAALAGHTEIVKFLIEQGADVNKQALEAGNYETPLMDAAENKHLGAVKALLKHGADPHLCNNEGYSTITKLFQLQEDDDEYEDVMKIINEFSSPQTNSELNIPPHTRRKIIGDPSESYFAGLVKKKSESLLYKYAESGNTESAANDFVNKGLSLSQMPDVLNLAARHGRADLVDFLLEQNPTFDINQVNKIGVTVLLATVGRGHYEMVKVLLARGADARIKRLKDGLSALEIASHSAHYDPREVVILEENLQGGVPKSDLKKSEPTRAEPSTEKEIKIAVPKSEMAEEKSSKPRTMTTTRVSSESSSSKLSDPSYVPSSNSDQSKSFLDPSPHVSDDEKESKPSTPKRKPSLGDSHVDKKSRPNESPDSHDQQVSSLNGSEVGNSDSFIKDAQSSSPIDNSKSPVVSTENPPIGLSSKLQEEQKLRAAEETKVWHEKAQAKKRARKEMFLQAEKEKERARKEEEEKRLELVKKQQDEEKERKRKMEIEAKKAAEEMERKRQIMEERCVFEAYPIGLQQAVFDGRFSKENCLRYTPFYVFDFENDNWVVDIQVSLFLSVPVADLHSILEQQRGPAIDDVSKDKMWSLFAKMVGIGKNNVIESNGMEKFRHLQMHYVRLNDIDTWMRRQNTEAHETLWANKRFNKVDLTSLKAVQINDLEHNSVESAPCSGEVFVPPRFDSRQDVLKTIKSANMPTW